MGSSGSDYASHSLAQTLFQSSLPSETREITVRLPGATNRNAAAELPNEVIIQEIRHA